jgi:inorganic pyrophosphatase
MTNLWKQLSPGPNPPDLLNVIVEIPKGTRNKYEYDKETGALRLDRVLYSSMHYPGDYGLIPQTFYDDGDPLDILVMINEPTFPGCVITARPIGLFKMFDGTFPDDKILAVPARDPNFDEVEDIVHVPKHYLAEVAHFFEVYKDLEGIRVHPIGWEPVQAALDRITHAINLYNQRFG